MKQCAVQACSHSKIIFILNVNQKIWFFVCFYIEREGRRKLPNIAGIKCLPNVTVFVVNPESILVYEKISP